MYIHIYIYIYIHVGTVGTAQLAQHTWLHISKRILRVGVSSFGWRVGVLSFGWRAGILIRRHPQDWVQDWMPEAGCVDWAASHDNNHFC